MSDIQYQIFEHAFERLKSNLMQSISELFLCSSLSVPALHKPPQRHLADQYSSCMFDTATHVAMMRACIRWIIEAKQIYISVLTVIVSEQSTLFNYVFTQTNTLTNTHDSSNMTVTRCIEQICIQRCPAVCCSVAVLFITVITVVLLFCVLFMCCGTTGHDANLQQGEPLQAACTLGAARCAAPVPGPCA